MSKLAIVPNNRKSYFSPEMLVFEFHPSDYGELVAQLVGPGRLCDLGPGSPNATAQATLERLSVDDVFGGRPVANRDMARCCVSALWLWHDFLDESHEISQTVGNSSGSYWHGIMHRREPDYSNAKYWFNRVGEHPIFERLARGASQLAGDEGTDGTSKFLENETRWDPFRFVDLCESVVKGRSAAELLCKKVARLEWQLLFDDCYRMAVGS